MCDQGYQTGYVYLSQADRTGSDAELVPSTGVGSGITDRDRELARLGLDALDLVRCCVGVKLWLHVK